MSTPALCWPEPPPCLPCACPPGPAAAGNGAEASLWEGTSSVDVSLMSADELAEYEDKKLKMRKVGRV